MLRRLGTGSRLELILTLAVIALVAITPLGREATAGTIFILHRLLLIFITVGSLAAYKSKNEPEVCPIFVILCSVPLLLMLTSVLLNPGSAFDGFYRWYQYLLFGTAFLAMAASFRQRSLQLKRVILYAVIAIDLTYLAAALLIGNRPFVGPFVNPNYFASFLLVGFSCAAALMLFDTSSIRRAAAGAAALVLYYGMTQAWSRGATVSAIVVTAVAIVRFSRERGLSRLKLGTIVVVILLGGALASPILVRKFLDRGTLDPYNYQRPKIWLAALKVIANHPLLGVGPGEFYYVSKRYSPPVEGTIARYLKRPAIAHSEYLQEAAESGLPAACLLFGLAGYLGLIAVRRARHCTSAERVFQEAAILATTGLAAHALVDNNWSVPVMAAGLVVFSLGDVLPLRDWRLSLTWSPRTRVIFAIALTLLVAHAVVIPGLAVTFNDAGQTAYNHQQWDRAESMYRLAAAIAPSNGIFLSNAGTVYLDKFIASRDQRWLNYAQILFTEASLANPNSDQPGHSLERVLIQRLTGDGKRDRAVHIQIIKVDRHILEIDPVNPFVRKNLAEALYNTGDHSTAVQEMERALEFEPNYIPAYLRLSDWFRDAGDPSRGDEYRQRGLAVAVKYQNEKTNEPYESLLLGRPLQQAAEQK